MRLCVPCDAGQKCEVVCSCTHVDGTAHLLQTAIKEEAKQAAPEITMGYNKTSSFFDNISCESSAGGDRSGGYNRWVPSSFRLEYWHATHMRKQTHTVQL